MLTTLSNGNVALMVNMAKRGGLPWDVILGAEPTRHYKPQREAYIGTADYLGLEPGELMLVAAHNEDLKAASGFGLRTAFVPRPNEHGAGQTKDLEPEGPWDVVATNFVDLAEKMVLIAQITDTHIRPEGSLAYGRVDTSAFLARAVDHILHLDPRPDVVLGTSDLVDGGTPAEYARLRHLLSPLPMPIYLIPGNHDDREALRAGLRGLSQDAARAASSSTSSRTVRSV